MRKGIELKYLASTCHKMVEQFDNLIKQKHTIIQMPINISMIGVKTIVEKFRVRDFIKNEYLPK